MFTTGAHRSAKKRRPRNEVASRSPGCHPKNDLYTHSGKPVHPRWTRSARQAAIDSQKRPSSSVQDPLGRSNQVPHWKQRAGTPSSEQVYSYFTTADGDSSCFASIGGERVQLVLANPSTNITHAHIHMNKCSHAVAHSRLGHPNDEYYNIMQLHDMVKGLSSLEKFDRHVGTACHDCPHGHAHSRPVPHSSARTPTAPNECIYMDVGGPMPVRGLNDELYFNMCRCKYLGHRVIYFMKSKDEIVGTVRQYLVETRAIDLKVAHIEYSVKLIVTDSDKLYIAPCPQKGQKSAPSSISGSELTALPI